MCAGRGEGEDHAILRMFLRPAHTLREAFLPSLAAINCTRGALITAREMHTNTLYDVTRGKRQICSRISRTAMNSSSGLQHRRHNFIRKKRLLDKCTCLLLKKWPPPDRMFSVTYQPSTTALDGRFGKIHVQLVPLWNQAKCDCLVSLYLYPCRMCTL